MLRLLLFLNVKNFESSLLRFSLICLITKTCAFLGTNGNLGAYFKQPDFKIDPDSNLFYKITICFIFIIAHTFCVLNNK